MSTEWKSQQGDGKYSLQFETGDKEKYMLVEKAAQMAVDGKIPNAVEVVWCKDCKYWNGGDCFRIELTKPSDFCSYGEKKEPVSYEGTENVIGNRINILLKSSGKKQKDLAEFLDVTANTVSYYVTGTRTPNVEQIINIARFFEVSTDYILGANKR